MNAVQTGTRRPAEGPAGHADLRPLHGGVPGRGERSQRRRRGRRRPQRRGRRGDRPAGHARPRPRETLIGDTEVTYSDDGNGRQRRDPEPRQRHRRRSRWPPSTRSATSWSRPRSARSTDADGQGHRRSRSVEDFSDLLGEPDAAGVRVRARARVPADAGHVPLDRDPDQGDRPQPALRGRCLRRAGAGVPERLGRVAARLRVQRRRHQLAAAVPLRDPVRALDGLPRVHPDPGPRGSTTGA